MSKSPPMKYRVVIEPGLTKAIEDPDEKTVNLFCFGLFGKSLENLVQDIKLNRDGKYDELYGKE